MSKKKTNWNTLRYCALQTLRKEGKLTDEHTEELRDMAFERLFSIIETDPDIKAVFKRLKNNC